MNQMQIRLLLLFSFFLVELFLSCNGTTYTQGERLYKAHCANCHMDDGQGLALLIPPLANSDYLKNNQDLVPCILRHGQKGKILVNGVMYDQAMPGEKYTDIQINNMINYINTAWGNTYPTVTITETKSRLDNCSN